MAGIISFSWRNKKYFIQEWETGQLIRITDKTKFVGSYMSIYYNME
jgi:hypothetical protein